jgi:hypothetical protein
MAIVGERKRKKKATVNIKNATIHANEPYDDKRWEKEEDVRALARAHAIKKDPERHKRAIGHAKTMKDEHEHRMAESKAIVDMANKGK